MTLNLKGAQRVVEKLMESDIKITRVTGKTLDNTTGLNVETSTTLYEGKAILGSDTSPEFYRPDSGERDRVYYTVMVPLDESLLLKPYDTITVVSNPRVPQIEGRTMVIIGPVSGTFEVATRVRAWMDTGT